MSRFLMLTKRATIDPEDRYDIIEPRTAIADKEPSHGRQGARSG